MSRENRVGRDQRPPAARFAEIEAALDKRVLAALAAAWSMATERNLVAGVFWDRAAVEIIAEKYAEPIDSDQAADVIEALNGRGDTLGEDEIIDRIWDVIA